MQMQITGTPDIKAVQGVLKKHQQNGGQSVEPQVDDHADQHHMHRTAPKAMGQQQGQATGQQPADHATQWRQSRMAAYAGGQGDTQNGTSVDAQGGGAGKGIANHLLDQQSGQSHGGAANQRQADTGQFVQADQQLLLRA